VDFGVNWLSLLSLAAGRYQLVNHARNALLARLLALASLSVVSQM